MPTTVSGLRAILSSPWVYDFFQALVGARKARREVVRRYIRPRAGDRVLDLGCGTGEILEFLPDVRYLGMDASAEYISSATARYGGRGCFRVGDASAAVVDGPFDLVLGLGLLHHLDDAQARSVLSIARSVLAPGGRLVTWDPCLIENQPRMARWLVLRDRGENVRAVDAYVALAAAEFQSVRATVRQDLLHVPFTHVFLECESLAAPVCP